MKDAGQCNSWNIEWGLCTLQLYGLFLHKCVHMHTEPTFVSSAAASRYLRQFLLPAAGLTGEGVQWCTMVAAAVS